MRPRHGDVSPLGRAAVARRSPVRACSRAQPRISSRRGPCARAAAPATLSAAAARVRTRPRRRSIQAYVAACQCAEHTGTDWFVDPSAGSDAAAGVFPTGNNSPSACRYKTLGKALSFATASGNRDSHHRSNRRSIRVSRASPPVLARLPLVHSAPR